MSDSEAWKEYCDASLDLSNQEDVGEDSYKAIDYKVLTMKLLGAVKELSSKNEALEARIAQLESN